MARRGKKWAEILGTVGLSAVTIGAGAFLVDWLKTHNYWPKPKELDVAGESDMGCDSCMGEDPLVEEAAKL